MTCAPDEGAPTRLYLDPLSKTVVPNPQPTELALFSSLFVRKSPYDSLLEDFAARACLWTDTEFPANAASFGLIPDVEESPLWRRIS